MNLLSRGILQRVGDEPGELSAAHASDEKMSCMFAPDTSNCGLLVEAMIDVRVAYGPAQHEHDIFDGHFIFEYLSLWAASQRV